MGSDQCRCVWTIQQSTNNGKVRRSSMMPIIKPTPVSLSPKSQAYLTQTQRLKPSRDVSEAPGRAAAVSKTDCASASSNSMVVSCAANPVIYIPGIGTAAYEHIAINK